MDIIVKKSKEDIEAALGLLNHDKNFLRTSKYNMIYQHTNEELDYYMSKFPIRDGKVLTVAASGDQTLQAISLGAREVTTFDINKFTYYFTYLKYVASCVLEYDEFIKYFGYFTLANNNFHNLVNKIDDSFGIEIYEQIRLYLPENIREFWDNMYIKGDFVQNKKNLLIPEISFMKKSSDFYLTKENYEKLASKVQNANISFVNSDLLKLPQVLNKSLKYNSMFFSNIFDWCYDNRRAVAAIKYRDFIINEMSLFLEDFGMMAVYAPVFGDDNQLLKYFPLLELDVESVDPKSFSKKRVKVYTYSK